MSHKRDLQRIKAYQRYTAHPENNSSTLHRQSTGGCVRLELNNIFNLIAAFFSEQCGYSKGEHMSYSISILKINDMQGLSKVKGWLNKAVNILINS